MVTGALLAFCLACAMGIWADTRPLGHPARVPLWALAAFCLAAFAILLAIHFAVTLAALMGFIHANG